MTTRASRPRTKYQPVLKLPSLPHDQYQGLRDNIAVHGVLVPILVDEDRRIIDGSNRKAIADGLGYDCPEIVQPGLTEEEKRTLARALNLARRQLAAEQKRLLVADQLQETPGRSNRWVAKQLGVSHHTVGSVRAELQATGRCAQFDRTQGRDGKYRPATRETVPPSAGLGRYAYEQPNCGLSDEWITPRYLLDALGPFDLDPCASVNRPWDTARFHYTESDDGLVQRWRGRVWLNPPYGDQIGGWMRRLADHGDGIALVFARTDAAWFFDTVWERASGVLFLRGRITFLNLDGVADRTATAPSVLVSYDRGRAGRNAESLKGSRLDGKFVRL